MPGLDEVQIKQTPLWNHMAQVLSHVISERPVSALESIVPTSNYVLTGRTVPPKGTSVFAETRPMAKSDVPVDALHNTRWASNFCSTVAPPKPRRKPLDGEDEEEIADQREEAVEEEEAELPGVLSDVVAEQHAFNAVGAGLPCEDGVRLVIGLKHLLRTEPLASVRFWGKVMGSAGDYYIAETKIDPARLPEDDEEEPEEDEDEGQPVEAIADVFFSYAAKKHRATPREEAGTGLNELVYYAASTIDPTRWTRLPDVTPQQVAAARLVRNGFTGDLDAPVHSHPCFPGTERHYLRAQLARINCTCRVAPRDMFLTEGAVPEADEDEDGNPIPPPSTVPAYAAVPPLIPQEAPDEDDTETIQPIQSWYRGYTDDELLQGKYWAHIAPTLLRNGRVTSAVSAEDAEEDDGTGAEPDEAVNLTEMINPFLSEVSKDAPLTFPGHSRSSFPAWSFRKGFHNESSATCTYAARSGLWPGAVTYAITTKGKPGAQYQMLYVGTGLKNLQGVDYAPQLPPKYMTEFPEDDLTTQRDCTVDEELEYAPLPPRPQEDDEEEEDDEDN